MALTQVDQGLLSSTAQYTGFKNRIINGAMVISQKNGTSSVTPASGDYILDRWRYSASQASKVTAQQNAGSVTLPSGYINYLGVTSSSAYSVGASDYFGVQQRIEGLNIADLGWGTASAKTVTLSAWVYSSLTGTFGGAIQNYNSSRSYPFTYSIPVANTWTQISVTIAGDTSGTWLTTNGIGILAQFALGVGSTYSGTAGAWASGAYESATGTVSVVGTNGATFYITGVQLEVGSTATSFDYRPYGTELQLCQRYLPAFNSTGSNNSLGFGYSASTTASFINFDFKVEARVPPTSITSSGTFTIENGIGAAGSATSLVFNCSSKYSAQIQFNSTAGSPTLTAGQGSRVYGQSTAKILFNGCEL